MTRERQRMGSPLQLPVFRMSKSPLIVGAARLAVAAAASIVMVDGSCAIGREAEEGAVTAGEVLG